MFSDTEVWGYICDPAANLGEITFGMTHGLTFISR